MAARTTLNSLTNSSILALALAALVSGAASAEPAKPGSTGSDSTGSGSIASASSAAKPGAPKPVLDPNNYIGLVKAGYAAAKEVPDICDKLFCYCGCDLTDCHGSLLDCFTSDHGVDCRICQEEAILALKYHKQGKSLAQIQKIIDKRYEKEYPFEVESEALQKYKASRLYKGSSKFKHKDVGELGSINPDNASQTGSSQNPPKRKLRKDGSCCEGDPKK